MGTFKDAKALLKASYNTSSVIKGVTYWQTFLLSKVQNLFYYKNLPESLPSWEIEKNLIIKGCGCVIKKNNKLYIPFSGSVFGYDEYYVPNKFTYSQPILGSGTVTDKKDGAIIWNLEIDKINYNASIIFETIQRYSRLLADLESTYHSILIAQRTGRIGVAQNSQVAQAVDEVMSKIELGDYKTLVNTSAILDTFKPLSFMPTGSLMEFTSVRDYLLNCFYNEIGLQTLEEKRERMVTSEIQADGAVLDNNIDRMYYMRLKNIAKINEVFKDVLDTPIEVYLNNNLGGGTHEC